MFALAFGLALLPALGAAQFQEAPPTTAAPDTIRDCTYWQVAAAEDTCDSIAAYWGITLDQFKAYNPSQAAACDLIVGNSYCIEQNFGITTTTASPTPSSTTFITSSTAAASATPSSALEVCMGQMGSYKEFCPRCLPNCEKREPSVWEQCFYSQAFTMNYYQSDCWKHGGPDCKNQAADKVCPRK
ncbi:hypothetical protein PG990_010859 [Apiospora arundinis]